MTDNEIIKALECYIKENEFEYFHSNTMNEYPLIRKALNLINRLMDKNKAYKHYYDECLKDLKKANAEVERLKDYPKCVYEYDGDITDYCLKTPCPNYKTVDAIRTEAVKEFAELLKEHIRDYHPYYYVIDEEVVDNLVEEMAGENNAPCN